MAKLPMRASLANLHEAESFKNAHGFPWFENRQGSHCRLHHDRLCADKLGFHPRFPVLQKHMNHLAEVLA